jgi:purine nucleosidase
VLFPVLGDRGYFDLSPRGRVTIAEKGSCRFREDASGRHNYLILRPEQKLRVVEALVQLCSQPPQGNMTTDGGKEDLAQMKKAIGHG